MVSNDAFKRIHGVAMLMVLSVLLTIGYRMSSDRKQLMFIRFDSQLKSIRASNPPAKKFCQDYFALKESYVWQMFNFTQVPTSTRHRTAASSHHKLVQLLTDNSSQVDRTLLDSYYNSDCEHFKVNVSQVCDDECQRFRQLLKAWPSDKPKAFIYYLSQLSRLNTLLASLILLERNFNSKFQYPIIIFTDEDAFKHESVREKIRTVTNASFFFQNVELRVPSHIRNDSVPTNFTGRGVGYRNMCRFQAKLVYEQAIFTGVDYALRLDDDSAIAANIESDWFRYMQTNNKTYGFVYKTIDNVALVLGLWEASCTYAASELHNVEFFEKFPRPHTYFNNFEISALSFWYSCEYQKYMDYIDRLGGIYYLYWGDAPIKSIAVSLFVPETKVQRFNFTYLHKGFDPLSLP